MFSMYPIYSQLGIKEAKSEITSEKVNLWCGKWTYHSFSVEKYQTAWCCSCYAFIFCRRRWQRKDHWECFSLFFLFLFIYKSDDCIVFLDFCFLFPIHAITRMCNSPRPCHHPTWNDLNRIRMVIPSCDKVRKSAASAHQQHQRISRISRINKSTKSAKSQKIIGTNYISDVCVFFKIFCCIF